MGMRKDIFYYKIPECSIDEEFKFAYITFEKYNYRNGKKLGTIQRVLSYDKILDVSEYEDNLIKFGYLLLKQYGMNWEDVFENDEEGDENIDV